MKRLDLLYNNFLMFCEAKDNVQAIRTATILIDEYKASKNIEGILMLNQDFTRAFKSTMSYTASWLIKKEAINAAIELVEKITDNLPSDELISLICANVLQLPTCVNDVDFMLSSIQRIALCYKSEDIPKLLVIAYFLPALQQCFNMFHEWLKSLIDIGELDRDSIIGLIEVWDKYESMLFGEDAPKLVDGTPYQLNDNYRQVVDKYNQMIREEEELAGILLHMTEDKMYLLPQLQKRYEKVLDYYLTATIDDQLIFDIEVTSHLTSCYAMWRELDMEYVLGNIEPYAQKLMTYEPGDCISTGTIYLMQTVLTSLSEVYEYEENAEKQYNCYLRIMQLCNIYFKRICFERGLESFFEAVKEEYINYHIILAKAIYLVHKKGFSINELYFELCKRKNLLYLGEMWQKQGRSVVEINELLKKEFTMEELRSALGQGNMLIDFIYVRINNDNSIMKSEYLIDILENFGVFAFTMLCDNDVQYYIIDKGTKLADKINNIEKSSDYFKEFTEYILGQELKAEGLVVCADGDFNRINIAALPYLDGYVIDYYTVRNIGSVFDLVYPNERKPVKNALLFNAPDYGDAGGSGWEYLFGSKIEQLILANTLGENLNLSVDCLYGRNASKAELKNRLENKYSLLHISTHGTVIDGKVSIVAAGANNKNEDALISDKDMNDSSLENTSVVVFALCFGARQLLSLQDSLSGFIKTSLLSGINTVIAPIEPIDDLSAIVLLNEFYKFYLQHNSNGYYATAEQALRKAIYRTRNITKQEFLQEYGIELDTEEKYPFSEPRYWAPWVCFSKEEMR